MTENNNPAESPEENFKETVSLTIGDMTICIKLSTIEYIIIEPDDDRSSGRAYKVVVDCKETQFCMPIANNDYGKGYKAALKAVLDLRVIWDRYLNKGSAAQATGNDSSICPNSLDSINPILSLG
jgi:hypothetical protein